MKITWTNKRTRIMLLVPLAISWGIVAWMWADNYRPYEIPVGGALVCTAMSVMHWRPE